MHTGVMAFALAVTSTSAIAADRGFYVGASVGQANTEVEDVFGSGLEFDESDFAFKILAGYRFLPWLAVEGAYLDSGSPSAGGTAGAARASLGIDIDALVGAAVFVLPIGERFELFLKPGFAYWQSDTNFRYEDPEIQQKFSDDDSGSAFFLGAGGAFNVSDKFALRLEYEWFDVAPTYDDDLNEFVNEVDATTGFVSAGFTYSF